MALNIYHSEQKPTTKGGPGFNTWFNNTGANVDPWINIMSIADMRFPATGSNPQIRFIPHSAHDPNTGLPKAIPSGYDRIRFAQNFQNHHAGHPAMASYVLRYWGLTPAYSWSWTSNFVLNVAGNTTVPASGSGEITFDISAAATWNFELLGPDGDLPPGYEVRIMRQSDVAAFDNTSVPITDATRLFKPEFLALHQAWGMSELRMMDVQEINNDFKVRDISYHYPVGSCFIGRHARVEYLVSLCNALQVDLYYCFPVMASVAYKTYVCEYIRDNLDLTLAVKFENANEMWNTAFSQIGAGRIRGLQAVGVKAPGTVTLLSGDTAITSSGVDLTTIFGNPPRVKEIAIVGAARSYTVDTNSVTPNNANLLLYGTRTIDEVIDGEFYYGTSQDLEDKLGNVLLCQDSMTVVEDVFRPSGQMNRVTRILGGKFNDPGRTDFMLNPVKLYNKPDYVDPKLQIDAVAFNAYIGSGALNENFRSELEARYNTGDTEGWRNLFTECLMGRHPTINVGNNMVSQEAAARNQWAICRRNGVKMLCYEGGPHLLQDSNVDPDDTYIFETYTDWMQSPQATEIFERWTDWFIKYFDGPIQKFTFMGSEPSHFGDWSTWTRYDDSFAKNELVKAMADFIGRDPWWDENYIPQLPKWIDPITLTAGEEQVVDLRIHFSNNAKVFSTMSAPPGMSLWENGVLTGAPTASARTTYVFTGANKTGAVDLSLSIAAT